MPRGPGKKENYNLDYSRFNYLDNLEEAPPSSKKPEAPLSSKKPEADAAAGPSGEDMEGMPPLQDLLRGMPVELQEAFHLMQVAKENGDEKAQARANELALKAVEKGGPQVKQDFLANIAKQDPAVASKLRAEMAANSGEELPIEQRINDLRTQMEGGAEATRKQLEALQKQQEELERLKSPEDIMKFMSQGGLKPEDMQRIFSGDTAYMEECVRGMMDKSSEKGAEGVDPEKAVKAAEVLHGTLCGTIDEAEARRRIAEAGQPDAAPSVKTGSSAAAASKPSRKAPEPPAREISIPEYRLQYQKDTEGRYQAVELKCMLPGVAAMDSIVLDVSDEHLRLSTLEPAPGYVVNAGPFPVPIDSSAARAKFSKKKQELSITVPCSSI